MATPSDVPPDSPRAFAQATGLVLQLVGIILTLGTCCWWSFAGLTQQQLRPASQPASLGDIVSAANALQIWSMSAVCLSFAGGLALAALGLGLQAEKRRSGTIAAWTAGAGATFWFAYFGFALTHAAGVGRLIWIVLMLLVWGLCAVLSVISADELKRNPPPADLGKAPKDLKPDRLIDREMPPDLRQ
jgi:hypothetical protein